MMTLDTDGTWPIPRHLDGRPPRVSDSYHSAEDKAAGRSGRVHRGQDIMYRRREAAPKPYDHPWTSKYYEIPKNVLTPALAPWLGRIIAAGIIATGGVVWLDHGDGIGSGYHHLRGLLVGDEILQSEGPTLVRGAKNVVSLGAPEFKVGQIVPAGYPVGIVGGSPTGYGLVHLHADVVKDLDVARSTLERGRLAGKFQDMAARMKTWRVLSYEDAWADTGRVGPEDLVA